MFVTVTACANAGTVSMLWMMLELGNSSFISITNQELFFKTASIGMKLSVESQIFMLSLVVDFDKGPG